MNGGDEVTGEGALNCRRSLWRCSYSLLMQAIVSASDGQVYLKFSEKLSGHAGGKNHMMRSVFSSSRRNALTSSFTLIKLRGRRLSELVIVERFLS